MKVAGFTIIRNAVKYDYPVVEAIRSILPLCDEFLVLAGNSSDETLELIRSIDSPKIRIEHSVWNDELRTGGAVLAVETNKAKALISPGFDWLFYIQSDEVIHEKFHEPIRKSMLKYKDDLAVEGLLFDYVHFYGSYDYVATSRKWYRKEIRIIRQDEDIISYKDAQGFRKSGRKLNIANSGGMVYHYGWVKPPEAQQAKQESFHKMWHDDQWMEKHIPKVEQFDYSNIDMLVSFSGTHPMVMHDRIARKNWKFTFDPVKARKPSMRIRLLHAFEKLTGVRIGEYKNYRLIR